MLDKTIEFSLNQRLVVVLLSAVLLFLGVYSFLKTPVDAFPDISSTQVKIILKAPGLAPEEMETKIVKPLEAELQGVENQKNLKSVSKYAIADITIDFKEGTDIYKARAAVAEKLSLVMPSFDESVSGGMAPITTPLGEAFMFTVEGNITQKEKRELLDFVIKPALRSVTGVADINSLGGEAKAVVIEPNIAMMARVGVSIKALEEQIRANLTNDGAGRLDKSEESFIAKIESGAKSIEEISNIQITTPRGSVRLDEICTVKDDSLTRLGFVTKNGAGEATQGLVLTTKGANAKETIDGIKEKLTSLKSSLPKGVYIDVFYDRSELTKKAVDTVSKALFEAVAIVVLLLVLFLGDLRAAISVGIILPLSLSFAFVMMDRFGISANLMSMGGLAIAVGMLVDSAVVTVENIYSKLAVQREGERKIQIIYRAAKEVSVAVFSGILIIAVAFLPLLTLEGLEGKLFRPVALTIVFALFGSLILSLTIIPVVCSFLLKQQKHNPTRLDNFFSRLYDPLLEFALTNAKKLFLGAVLLLALSLSLFLFVGKSFIPTLDEGDIILSVETTPSISLERSKEINLEIQKAILQAVPEVSKIVARSGSDELGLDPMGLNQTDTFISLKPKEEWTAKNKEEIKEKIKEALKGFTGISFGFTQPIEMRVSEMLTGTRGDLAVKIYGHDIEKLNALTAEVEDILKDTNGAAEVLAQQNEGFMYLTIRPDRYLLSQLGVDMNELKDFLKLSVDGIQIGTIPSGSYTIPVVLRGERGATKDIEAFKNIPFAAKDGSVVPLSSVLHIEEVEGPLKIERQNLSRYSSITANVEGRDLVGFVEEAKSKIQKNIKLPYGYKIEYGGEFENQQRAAAKLMTVIPISIGIIFLILFFTFRSVWVSLLILLNIPFAITGGIISLFVSGEYMSVPASVGFIALFGIAVLNGVVMVSYMLSLLKSDVDIETAVREGAKRRLRPVLMTAFIAGFGLLPLLFATGVGSEIQKPLAIVVLGGLFTSTALTLTLLPPIFKEAYKRGLISIR